ncbi:TPA: hypothetical protein JLL64_002710 [Escherichia coli]|nr:hypothetical protein [Escherichia coli]HAW1307449.1 hypothetical protein [Escherichia coli]
MHRIDTKTAQKDKFGAGKNGFTRGNPQTGTPATDLDDDYFDMLQEELCSVVEASGASLEKGRHDQLLTALRALLLSRKNPFGDIKSDGTVQTALENLGLGDLGTASGRNVGNTQSFEIPDMSYFQLTGKGSDNLLAKLPNGLIIQVFRRRLSNSTTIGIPTTIPVTYPTPFPSNVWGVFCTKATYAQIVTSCESATTTGFDAVTCLTSGTSPDSNLSDAYFFAIGY